MKAANTHKKDDDQQGFSLPEVTIVLLIIAIIMVFALPQINASRRAFRFSGIQRQIASALSDARQAAMSQRLPVSVRFEDAGKRIIVHGGRYGSLGDVKNQIVELSGSGLDAGEIVYGRPTGAPTSALSDTANLTALVSGAATITFQADGSVVNAANNPQNNAFFIYHNKFPQDMAFAISVLGAGGRVKVWRFNKDTNLYVE